MWGINQLWLHLIHEKHIQLLYFLVLNHAWFRNGFSMWLELMWWICNLLIFHQHILLIACEPLLNLMTNYVICVAGKQWEALRFTIGISTCMACCLIAHYCAIAGTIIIFWFITIWSCACRSWCQRFWPTVRPFLHMAKWVVHEYQSSQETQKDC